MEGAVGWSERGTLPPIYLISLSFSVWTAPHQNQPSSRQWGSPRREVQGRYPREPLWKTLRREREPEMALNGERVRWQRPFFDKLVTHHPDSLTLPPRRGLLAPKCGASTEINNCIKIKWSAGPLPLKNPTAATFFLLSPFSPASSASSLDVPCTPSRSNAVVLSFSCLSFVTSSTSPGYYLYFCQR